MYIETFRFRSKSYFSYDSLITQLAGNSKSEIRFLLPFYEIASWLGNQGNVIKISLQRERERERERRKRKPEMWKEVLAKFRGKPVSAQFEKRNRGDVKGETGAKAVGELSPARPILGDAKVNQWRKIRDTRRKKRAGWPREGEGGRKDRSRDWETPKIAYRSRKCRRRGSKPFSPGLFSSPFSLSLFLRLPIPFSLSHFSPYTHHRRRHRHRHRGGDNLWLLSPCFYWTTSERKNISVKKYRELCQGETIDEISLVYFLTLLPKYVE